MTDLNMLISTFQQYIKANDPIIQNIKRPYLLLKYLRELRDDIIGLDKIKNSVAQQIMFLMEPTNHQNQMLHTVLYGPPGVGKTSIGIKLAKIWYAMGFLENTAKYTPIRTTSENEEIPLFKASSSSSLSSVGSEYIALILLVVYAIASILKSGIFAYGWYILIIFGICIFVVVLYTLSKRSSTSKVKILPKTQTPTTKVQTKTPSKTSTKIQPTSETSSPSKSETSSEITTPSILDDSIFEEVATDTIIKVVSRTDFVSGFLGQTTHKTKKLLMDNIGKVLFIDEAYSLLNENTDPYGMEAITTLNLFMSENPDKIVIIIAGYKDLLQKGLFKHQPGLVRRCMWHFECDGYTPSELFKIFRLQVQRNNKKISDPAKTLDLIVSNANVFTSYAGDTEKLFFYSQLEATRDKFSNKQSSGEPNEITPKHIEIGIQKLKENNINNTNINDVPKSSNISVIEKFLNDRFSS